VVVAFRFRRRCYDGATSCYNGGRSSTTQFVVASPQWFLVLGWWWRSSDCRLQRYWWYLGF